MSDMRYHPRWGIYKKLRRTIALMLEKFGLAADDAAIDRQLEQHLAEYTYDLVVLFHRDQVERDARSNAARGRVV